jgi:hypothetical protein
VALKRLVVLLLLGGCSQQRDKPVVVHQRQPVAHVANESNISPGDYIGPDACGGCHPDEHARWTQSLHRVMNARVDDPGAVIASFDDVRVPYKQGVARMTREGASLVMTTGDVRYRVTRTIGHRGLQEFVGVEDGGSGAEVRLPFGWWPRAGGWQPQVAFDPWLDDAHFDAFAPVREPWAERCPWCHSTYPFAQRIARASGPRRVGHGLEQRFQTAPGGDVLDVARQVTTGISCESCHLGGRAHAEGAPIQFMPRGAVARADLPAVPATFAEQRANATVINTVCAQCHSGPSPRLADGTALRNSSEALDLEASRCAGAKCTDCHDPHRADGQPDERRAIAACVGCHPTQAGAAHAGTGHGSVTCLDCHMPRIVMGIDHYVRTHRISSPANAELLAQAAPNACNLCHLDRPIEWTLTELRLGWEARPRVASLAAYGGDGSAVGDVWLASTSPAVRLIAADAYARSPLGTYALATIRKGLTDPLPYVRMWTQFAVDAITSRRDPVR